MKVFYTKAEKGYLMNVAATPSFETWGGVFAYAMIVIIFCEYTIVMNFCE